MINIEEFKDVPYIIIIFFIKLYKRKRLLKLELQLRKGY